MESLGSLSQQVETYRHCLIESLLQELLGVKVTHLISLVLLTPQCRR